MAFLLKSNPIARKLAKWTSRIARRTAKQAEKREQWAADEIVRFACFQRDKGRCRVCGESLLFKTPNPYRLAHNHHVVYRSAGGTNGTANRVTVCAICHQQEHEHRIDISGNADGLILIAYMNIETGRLRQMKESPNPSL